MSIVEVQIAVIDSVVQVLDVVFLKGGNAMEVRLQDRPKNP